MVWEILLTPCFHRKIFQELHSLDSVQWAHYFRFCDNEYFSERKEKTIPKEIYSSLEAIYATNLLFRVPLLVQSSLRSSASSCLSVVRN